ncbi:MAG: hypothetical protein ABFC95_08130 [Smithella sp.]
MVIVILVCWSGIIILALRVMFSRSFDNVDVRITTFVGTVDKKLAEFSAMIDKRLASFGSTEKACYDLQRELLELKAQLPLEYVRREDFIRFEVGINYKLDKLRELFLEKLDNREKK